MPTPAATLVNDCLVRGGGLSTAYSPLMVGGLIDAIDDLATAGIMPALLELQQEATYAVPAETGSNQKVPWSSWGSDVWIPCYLTDDTNQNNMQRVDIREINIETSSEQAEVTRYAIWNKNFIFAPAFSESTSLRLQYISTVEMPSWNGSTVEGDSPFDEQYDSVLRLLALGYALVTINPKLAASFQAQAERKMGMKYDREGYHNMVNQTVTIAPRFR